LDDHTAIVVVNETKAQLFEKSFVRLPLPALRSKRSFGQIGPRNPRRARSSTWPAQLAATFPSKAIPAFLVPDAITQRTEEETVISPPYTRKAMTKRSPDEAIHRDLVMWALFKTVAAIAIAFIVLLLLADLLWIVCPRLMEPLLR
jgi:hypothetical protein